MLVLSRMLEGFFTVLKACRREIQLGVVVLSSIWPHSSPAEEFKLEPPIECEFGVECFFQNFADLDPGPEARDPWCGGAAYDGHKGTDIRLLSLKDITKNVPVTASATGIVKAVRDGEPDNFAFTSEDRNRVTGKECGNGVVIDHSDGYQTQYCHLKQGSVKVRPGQAVKVGNVLGYVGNSGFSEFPHVHVTLRKDGEWLDLVSGLKPAPSCAGFNPENGYLSERFLDALPDHPRQLMDSGLTGNVFEHNQLVKNDSPATALPTDQVTLGWAWLINLSKGDIIAITVVGPNGFRAENKLAPLDRNKAAFSVFAGKRTMPPKGVYTISLEITNKDKPVLQHEKHVTIE